MEVKKELHLFPFCVVWTPIPLLSWVCPFLGHMGIATSRGVIRDFGGCYYVSENDMAFGWPTLYKQFSPNEVEGGAEAWDLCVAEACNVYGRRVHVLCYDNCHSFVAFALNKMRYGGRSDWNMFRLALDVNLKGEFVGFGGFLRQYLPTFLILTTLLLIAFFSL